MDSKQEPQDLAAHLTWPDGEVAQCQCPYCGNFDAMKIGKVREWDCDCCDGYCSNCGAEYTVVPVDGAVVGQKLPYDAQNYMIRHHYDVGDQGVSVMAPDNLDVKRAAVYIQFQAEEWFGIETPVSNLGIAAALVKFYGCKHARRNTQGNVIDMFHDREEMCRESWSSSSSVTDDVSLHRDGLREFIRSYICH